jgi:hydroxyacylglutathione hydrolase
MQHEPGFLQEKQENPDYQETMSEKIAFPLHLIAIHPVRIPFSITTPAGPVLRFVYVYLIYTRDTITLIDTGVAGSETIIFDYIHSTGREPGDIGTTILTHAHPDHIGAAKAIHEATGCTIAAHGEDQAWIEDTARQEQERPVPVFSTLVAGPVTVDWVLKDGDVIELDEERTLTVIHTPGHSPGSIALLLRPEMVLFSGDAIPVPGDLPIYDDPAASLGSIGRLMDIEGIMMLYSSWDEPREGEDVYWAMDDGFAWIQRIQEMVKDLVAKQPTLELPELTRKVLKGVGLPEELANPMVMRTIHGHRIGA